MANFAGLSLDAQEVVDFLRKKFYLPDIYREIIEQKIIHEVAREHGIAVTLKEIEMEVENVRFEKEFDRPDGLAIWLSDRGITLSDLKQAIHSSLLAQKVVRHLFLDQVEALFLEHRSSFEQLVIYKLVVPYEHLAQELFYQIEEEEISFFEAAHIYDMDETRRMNCGYEGKLLRRKISPELAERLANASVGELIGPIKAANQFYELFWIDDVITPELTPGLQADILNQFFQDWIDNNMDEYLEALGLRSE